MTPSFSDFAAQVREFIQTSARPAALKDHERFNELALVLFTLQFGGNESYRKFCEFRGMIPRGVKHWTQIPAVPTTAFKELDLTSLPPENRTLTFHSSGTTAAVRSRHHHSTESLALYEASLLRWSKNHLLPDLDRVTVLSLTPPGNVAPPSSLVHMFETIQRHFGTSESLFAGEATMDGAWTVNTDRLIDYLHRTSGQLGPVLLLGTAFNYVQVLDYFAEAGLRFRLPPRSALLETGGYKGRSKAISKSRLHTLLSEHLAVDPNYIISEYGMSELSSQGYDNVAGRATGERVFQFPPWARAQIVSPESGQPVAHGQTGLIRIFDLANVWSVMAIQTEDLGISRDRGFELLGRTGEVEPRGCSLMTQ